MSRTPAFALPSAVLWLGIVFAAVHGARQLMSVEAERWTLLAFAFIPARYDDLAVLLPGGLGACFWSPLTYAFLHADFLHLAVNLVWMAAFGSALARRFGTTRFLLLSLVATVAGAGLHYLVYSTDDTLVIGASGAVSGMMAGASRFAFSPGGPLAGGGSRGSYTLPAEPLTVVIGSSRALGFILVWFAVNLVFGLTEGLVPGVSSPIAWEAHVGGFLAGLLAFPLLDPVPRSARPSGDDPLAS